VEEISSSIYFRNFPQAMLSLNLKTSILQFLARKNEVVVCNLQNQPRIQVNEKGIKK